MSRLEHINITVPDPKATAQMLIDLFEWNIRWEGEAMNGLGYSIHVGNVADYLALYSGSGDLNSMAEGANYTTSGALNHIGVVVEDLDATEEKVKALGFEPHSHQDYEPGRRFYFHDQDGIEIEVVCYDD